MKDEILYKIVDVFMCFLLLFIAALMCVFPFACINEGQEKTRLINQCMQDHKEYECEAILNSGRLK